MNKSIKIVLEELVVAAENAWWSPNNDIDRALVDIEKIIEQARPLIYNNDPFTNALKPALNQTIDQYQHNLKGLLK